MENYLITGLGNIGSEYSGTRHNIGFEITEWLARQKKGNFETARYGDICTYRLKGRKIILLKPSTYMNLSGKAIRYYMAIKKVNPENLLVLCDDVALPIGKIRIRSKGGDGGHNGLENIILTLNTDSFARLRFGIGNDYPQGMQIDYVLGRWFEEQVPIVQEKIKLAAEAVDHFVLSGVQRSMNHFNSL